jgi:lipopolysaccharide export system permease protein
LGGARDGRGPEFPREARVLFSILHRMILGEMFRVFALALLVITGILLMAGMVAEATQHGLGPLQILAVMPLIIPSTLPYTLPATTLFATCVVYGRLSHDNEILAVKTAGVNILRVVTPAVFIGLLTSGVTIGLYWYVIPTTHHMMRTMFVNDVEEVLYAMLKRDGCINHPKMPYVMSVHKVQGKKLLTAQFCRRDPKTGSFDMIARAKEAELRVDLAHKLLYVHMRQCHVNGGTSDASGFFEDRVFPVELPQDLTGGNKQRGADMTWEELLEAKANLEQEVEQKDAEIALETGRTSLAVTPEEAAKHVRNLRQIRQQKVNEIRNLDVEQHMRGALSLGCLCFVLVGCPVGIWFSKSDYLSAFITCFLPVVFLYYPLLLCGLNLAKSGKVPIEVAVWGSDAVMAVSAGVLFRRLMKN